MKNNIIKKKNLSWKSIKDDVMLRSNEKKDFSITKSDVKFDKNTGHIVGINNDFEVLDFPMNEWAKSQFFNRLNMPGKYFSNLMERGRYDLIANHANYQLDQLDEDKEFLLRTVKHNERYVRALLSNRYSPFDNDKLIEVINQILTKSQYNYDIEEYYNDDLTASFRVTFPDTAVDVNLDEIEKGDVLKASVMVMNSEVGKRGIYIMPVVYRMVCSNGLTTWQAIGDRNDYHKRHVGLDEEEVYDFSVAAFKQSMEAAYKSIQKFNELQKFKVANPEEKISSLLAKDKIPKRLVKKVQQKYNEIWFDNNSMFGVVNAITRVARDSNIDDKLDLETAAGNILIKAA